MIGNAGAQQFASRIAQEGIGRPLGRKGYVGTCTGRVSQALYLPVGG